jgi:hypothetical protein
VRYRILGAIAVIWGGVILVAHRKGVASSDGAGAYLGGETPGVLFALALLVVGLYYLIKGRGPTGPNGV